MNLNKKTQSIFNKDKSIIAWVLLLIIILIILNIDACTENKNKEYTKAFNELKDKTTCNINGFGKGKCKFLNKSNLELEGHCIGVNIVNKNNKTMKTTVCSGKVKPKNEIVKEFEIINMYENCVTPALKKGMESWKDYCDMYIK